MTGPEERKVAPPTGEDAYIPPFIERRNQRKASIKEHFDAYASERANWLKRGQAFRADDLAYLKFLIPEGLSILEVGCSTGDLMAALKPSRGLGIDISAKMAEEAQKKHPDLAFRAGDIEDKSFLDSIGEKFDVILMVDVVGYFNDCQKTFQQLRQLCHANTRLIVVHHSHLWEPIIGLSERFSLKMPAGDLNWLSNQDLRNLLKLSDFEVVKQERRQLVPVEILGLEKIVNRFIGTLPIIRSLSLRHFVVARAIHLEKPTRPSCSVVIPCRNERGNIEPAVKRLPRFCDDLEIIFIEGHSQDGTFDEMQRVKAAYPDLQIQTLQQPGKGKGDAVRAAFDAASKDILIILDADLTVPPEDVPKFYDAIASGKGEFINGTRFIYPMEDEAMRFLNYWANRTFSLIFSYLLNQTFTDTLCGTKVLTRAHYQEIARNRPYFGDFDPFGDFDLIFGASKLNLKAVELPIRYANREYGSTQISRFRHGWLLLKMVVFAYRKLKAF